MNDHGSLGGIVKTKSVFRRKEKNLYDEKERLTPGKKATRGPLGKGESLARGNQADGN